MKYLVLFLLLGLTILFSCNPTCPDPVPESSGVVTFETRLGPETPSGFLIEHMPTTSYPSYTEIFVGTWTHDFSPYVLHRYILAPDLSSIPQDAIIESAFITFYPTDNATSANVSLGQYNNYSDNSFYLERITTAWDEQNVAWNNQPETSKEHVIVVQNLGDGNTGSGKINILPLIQDMVALPESSYGIRIKLQNEPEVQYSRLIFASNNYSDPTQHPLLKITYKKKS